jgi:hypothetical protein
VLLDEECARSLTQALKKYHRILWRGWGAAGNSREHWILRLALIGPTQISGDLSKPVATLRAVMAADGTTDWAGAAFRPYGCVAGMQKNTREAPK